MRKYRLQTDNIDKLISALEIMIDTRDDIWEAEQRCDYRAKMEIEDNLYLPAKKILREALHDFIIEVIEEE